MRHDWLKQIHLKKGENASWLVEIDPPKQKVKMRRDWLKQTHLNKR